MSTYVDLDTDADSGTQVATNSGWSDFLDWVEGLDDKDYPQMAHLTDHGWSQQLAALESELVAALAKSPPDDADTRDVADSLLAVVKERGEAEVLTVTDGMGP